MSDEKQTKITSFFQVIPAKKPKLHDTTDDVIVTLTDHPDEIEEEIPPPVSDDASTNTPPSYDTLESLLPTDWKEALEDEFQKPYWSMLKKELSSREKTGEVIYPKLEHIFTAFHLTPIKSVRVVLFGQDPYHGPGQAHGLCFSVLPGVKSPPSLVNIYKELESDIPGFKRPNHGHLIPWAQQGVFMLNTVLTVKAHNANSHSKLGWIQFTDAVVNVLRNQKHIVWMLWGNPAQAKARAVDASKHLIIKTVHPSPLSASRGWFGSRPFSRCNSYLKDKGYKPIDWHL